MNDDERRNWVLNDEGLYSWWRSERFRFTLRQFIRHNRAELTKLIRAERDRPPEVTTWRDRK